MNLSERIEELKNEIDGLTKILADEGFMSTGSTGQAVVHPAIAARHAAIGLLHKLEASQPETPAYDPLDEFLN